jgi:excisionase family DNA binding protein
MTPREVARLLRVSKDRVRAWIEAGELAAVNVSPTRCGRPRYVVLPEHLAAWERSRRVSPPPRPAPRRRRQPTITDYYPD